MTENRSSHVRNFHEAREASAITSPCDVVLAEDSTTGRAGSNQGLDRAGPVHSGGDPDGAVHRFIGEDCHSPPESTARIPQRALSQNVPLTSGKHLIRVQVASDDGSTVDDSISGEFVRNSERNLSVSARRGDLSLSWQVANSAVGESSDHAGWLGRYASTLFLTIAGSIISALTGYAIKELPKQIGSRQSEAPKI